MPFWSASHAALFVIQSFRHMHLHGINGLSSIRTRRDSEIALCGSAILWVDFECDCPVGATLAPFLHCRRTEGLMAIDPLKFGPDALCEQLFECQELNDPRLAPCESATLKHHI
jgi:hypothetical protein